MFATKTNDNSDTVSPPSTPYPHVNKNKNGTMVLVPPNQQCNVMPWAVHIHIVSRYSCCTYLHTKYIFIIFPHDWSNKEKEKKRNWNTSKVASTLGYLKRLLGPLGKWREGIESALEGNSKRIRLGMPVNSLAFIYYHTVCTRVYQIYQYCLG